MHPTTRKPQIIKTPNNKTRVAPIKLPAAANTIRKKLAALQKHHRRQSKLETKVWCQPLAAAIFLQRTRTPWSRCSIHQERHLSCKWVESLRTNRHPQDNQFYWHHRSKRYRLETNLNFYRLECYKHQKEWSNIRMTVLRLQSKRLSAPMTLAKTSRKLNTHQTFGCLKSLLVLKDLLQWAHIDLWLVRAKKLNNQHWLRRQDTHVIKKIIPSSKRLITTWAFMRYLTFLRSSHRKLCRLKRRRTTNGEMAHYSLQTPRLKTQRKKPRTTIWYV